MTMSKFITLSLLLLNVIAFTLWISFLIVGRSEGNFTAGLCIGVTGTCSFWMFVELLREE